MSNSEKAADEFKTFANPPSRPGASGQMASLDKS